MRSLAALANPYRLLLIGVMVVRFAGTAFAEETVDFNRDIRPILTQHCFRCHGPDEDSTEAGLRLDLRERATMELDSGDRAIVPNHPEESQLLARVTSSDEDLRMPPPEGGEPLSSEEQELLRQWIAQSATYFKHWSIIPPQRPRSRKCRILSGSRIVSMPLFSPAWTVKN